jgi:hypothetical protein
VLIYVQYWEIMRSLPCPINVRLIDNRKYVLCISIVTDKISGCKVCETLYSFFADKNLPITDTSARVFFFRYDRGITKQQVIEGSITYASCMVSRDYGSGLAGGGYGKRRIRQF